jgi:hypothetical protein
MLTKLTIRNFKRFEEAEIELGNPVVFVGPNNSGKTSALQALALWDLGLKRWNEKREGQKTPEKRPGVAVNRRDLTAAPVPVANLLWRDLHTRNVRKEDGRQRTENVRVDVTVDGRDGDGAWSCGLEFDYANAESFYCRPLRLGVGRTPKRMPVPEQAGSVRLAYLPSMSGLSANEARIDPGAVNVRLGEGRTSEVLRNVCHRLHAEEPDAWDFVVQTIERLFGVQVDSPRYVADRGEVAMEYREGRVLLDLSSSGRGLQQTLLLLSYLALNPKTVLLLDEPDAHLEALRQREIYCLIREVAEQHGSQILIASHSEVLLNEAAGADMVIAFVGEPHRIGDSPSQVTKALASIGFDQYVQARQTGWVLYLEGSTDLAVLQAFAKRLEHESAARALERPLVKYIANQISKAESHFFGLREAWPDLQGIAIMDESDREREPGGGLLRSLWRRRESENYLCTRTTLESYASHLARETALGPLFETAEVGRRVDLMRRMIAEVEEALSRLGRPSPWSPECKVSDDFLTPLFEGYFRELGEPNRMTKANFYRLAAHVPDDEIDPEVVEKLDAIAGVSAAGEAVRETSW